MGLKHTTVRPVTQFPQLRWGVKPAAEPKPPGKAAALKLKKRLKL